MVSVVVSVFNGAKSIHRCLDSLFSLDYDNYEIILVNDGSTDDTGEICDRYNKRVRYIENKKNMGLAASRNRGIRIARGKYVAFTDADCVVDGRWLASLVGCLTENRAKAAGGAVKTPKDISFFSRCSGTLHKPSPLLLSEKEAEIVGCNAIFERSCLLEIGGFDERFRIADDDTDVNIRIRSHGLKVYHQPTAIIYHYHRGSPLSFVRWRFAAGIAHIMLAKKYSFKIKTIYNVFNLTLIPTVSFLGVMGLLTMPIILPPTLLLVYVAQFIRSYTRNRDEFTLSEIAVGVLLGWLLRIITSAGFWYGMLREPRNREKVQVESAGDSL
jgi:GT2 family glycosyltransferase